MSSSWFRRLVLLACLAASVFSPMSLIAGGPQKDATEHRVRRKVAPAYPTLAREMHISGTVKIEITIAANGLLKTTRIIGGHPLLVRASLDALKNWRWEPGPEETTVMEFHFDPEHY